MRSMLVEAILLAIQVIVLVRLVKPTLMRQLQDLILSLVFIFSIWRRT